MHRRLFLTAPLALAACTNARWDTTRLIVVRHGDRDGNNAPNLNETGVARMANLPDAIADLPLDAIYIPDRDRNRQSAAPLAQARDLTPQEIPIAPGVADRLLAPNQGRSIIWIGNTGNISEIWEDLDLPGRPPLNYGEISIIEMTFFGRFEVTERFVAP